MHTQESTAKTIVDLGLCTTIYNKLHVYNTDMNRGFT